MRQSYTLAFVLITAALLIVACILFAVTQGGQNPEPQRSARRSNRHLRVDYAGGIPRGKRS
jgi:hypothetical protein